MYGKASHPHDVSAYRIVLTQIDDGGGTRTGDNPCCGAG